MRPFHPKTAIAFATNLVRSPFGKQHPSIHNSHQNFASSSVHNVQSPAPALLPSQQHPLLPLPDATSNSSTSSSDFRQAFHNHQITKVAFLRHGNTAPSPNNIDYERILTDLGRTQSRIAGASYGIDELFPYYETLALCSPAPRCVETAELFLDATLERWKDLHLSGKYENARDQAKVNEPELHEIPEIPEMPPLKLVTKLYDDAMQPEGSRLFRSIGYAPLRTYLENPVERDASAAKNVLGSYARTALDGIWGVVSEIESGRAVDGVDNMGSIDSVESVDRPTSATRDTEKSGKTLLLFAHAIYLPAAALEFAMAVGCGDKKNNDLDLILDTNTKEAEGYLVNVEEQTVSLLHRPEDS